MVQPGGHKKIKNLFLNTNSSPKAWIYSLNKLLFGFMFRFEHKLFKNEHKEFCKH